MDDIFEDYFDEADAVSNIDVGTGKQLSQLVRTLRGVEDQIVVENIPALMDEMGVERLDVDGLTVERRMVVSASIPVDRREEAYDWLRANKLDDIIKNDVILSFGKGQDNVAGDVVGLLQDRGFEPSTKTHVHPSTLKAFVRERVTDGKSIDLDMFGAFITNTAQIKRKA